MKAFLTLLSLLLCTITSRAAALEYRIFVIQSDTQITAMEMNRLYKKGLIVPKREGTIEFTPDKPFEMKDSKTMRDAGFTMSGRCVQTNDAYDVDLRIEDVSKIADKIQALANGKTTALPIFSIKSLESRVTARSNDPDWIMVSGFAAPEDNTLTVLLRIRE